MEKNIKKYIYIYVLKTTQKINSFTTFKRMSAQSFPQQFSSKTPLHYSPGSCHEVHYPERSSTACLMEATFVVYSLEQMHPIYSSCNNDQLFSTRSGAANWIGAIQGHYLLALRVRSMGWSPSYCKSQCFQMEVFFPNSLIVISITLYNVLPPEPKDF